MSPREGKALLDHGNAIARRYAGRLGPDVAEDLRDEAVARALRSPPPDGRMQPWLERIYRNLFVDRWRRQPLRTVALAELPDLATPGTAEDEILRRERRRVVRQSLGCLPREARRALLSRYYGELDDRAAGSRLGVTPATIRTRVHRALARLRARLGELRAFWPPLFGKLGVQAAAVGMAPVMVATLIVASAAFPPAPPVPTAAMAILPLERPAARPGVHAAVAEPAIPSISPPPARSAKKLSPKAPATVAAPAAVEVALSNDEPALAEILQPDGTAIFAEPEHSTAPCLVTAPPDLLVQIDKMIEERL